MKRNLALALVLLGLVLSTFGLVPPVPQAAQAQAGMWYVSNTGSDANACNTPAAPCATIQAAVDRAASGDTVRVAVGTYTNSGPDVIVINKSVVLSGGWDPRFVTRSGRSIIDGQGARRGIRIDATMTSTIDRVVVMNGFVGSGNGAGIYSSGQLTVTNSSISLNSAGYGRGGGIDIESFSESGEYVASTLTLSQTSVYSNFASSPGGGIFINGGRVAINNSTIAYNVGYGGGGIFNHNAAAVNISSSTIANNVSINGGCGGLCNVYPNAVTMRNSILAGNFGLDCQDQLTLVGYNILGKNGGCTYLIASATDILNVDPQLGQPEGHPAYLPLLAGSPALNSGDPTGCKDILGQELLTDQRGAPRVGRCDIGAYEAGLSVNKTVTGQFLPNGIANYTIQLENTEGNIDLVNTVLTDTLPDSLTYFPGSLTASNGMAVANGNTVTWTGTVASNSTTSIGFQTTIAGYAVNQFITNTVAASWSGHETAARVGFDTSPRTYLPILARNYCANYFDDFSNPFSGWPTGDDEYLTVQYLNGEYRVQSKQPYLFLLRSPACERDNYTVEADMRWDGMTGYDIGLLFGIKPGFSQYYLIDIFTDSQSFYLFRRNTDGSFSSIGGGGPPNVRPGTQTNHIKVTRNGGQIILELNGIYVGTWFDNTITGPTRVGVFMAPYENAPVADARFDNFRVTTIGASILALPSLTPERAADPGQPLPADFQWRLPERELTFPQP